LVADSVFVAVAADLMMCHLPCLKCRVVFAHELREFQKE
jgi:hypothetical protein